MNVASLRLLVVGSLVGISAAGCDGKTARGLEAANERAAKVKALTLDTAVQTYAANHNGKAPTSLAVLTQPDPENNNKPYVTEDAILDPWNQPFQIDPTGPQNEGKKPDIFTTAPSGKVIGNFRSPS